MEKNKKWVLLPLIMALVFLATIFSANALTIDAPIASETVSGSYNFTATSTINIPRNCTWSTTADNNFGISTNTSTNQTSWWNVSATASTLTDTASTTLTVNCTSNTTSEQTTVTIAVDNANPTAVLEISTIKVELMKQFESDCSQSTDAIDTALSYSTKLYNPDGTQMGSTCTTTTGICDWDDGEIEDLGEHQINCTVTDNGANTDTAQVFFDVMRDKDDRMTITITAQKRNMMPIYLIGSFLMVVAVAITLIVLQKKK